MYRFIFSILLGCFILVGFSGCADLKEINAFALTSQQTIEKNKNIPYGFEKYAKDSAYIYNPFPDQLDDVECECIYGKKRDSLYQAEYTLLSNYFAALAQFTDPKSSVDITPVGNAIQSGTYAGIKISDDESSYIAAVSGFVSDLVTTGYKSKTIKDVMKKYHDSVAPLISFVVLNRNTLPRRIESMKESLKKNADLLLRNAHVDTTKWAVLLTYELQKKEFDEKLYLFKDGDTGLENIRRGEDLIFQNIDNLKSAEFKKKLKTIIRNLMYNADTKN